MRILKHIRNHIVLLTFIFFLTLTSAFGQSLQVNLPTTNGPVYKTILDSTSGILYICGQFTQVTPQAGSPVSRNGIAAIDLSTNTVTSWDAGSNNQVWAMVMSGSTLYVGGAFTSIGGESRNYIGAIDKTTGLATSWNPNANMFVDIMLQYGSTIIASGTFTSIGDSNRNKLAALDMTTGKATSWNTNLGPDRNIFAVAINGSTVYVGGNFESIGGQARHFLGAVDATTGLATSFNPNPNNYPYSIAFNGSTMYVGGYFTTIAGQTRKGLSAFDVATETLTSWDPRLGANFSTAFAWNYAFSGSIVYVGGSFDSVGGIVRKNAAAIDANSGAVLEWIPNPNSQIRHLALWNSTIYLSGNFGSILNQSRSFFAGVTPLAVDYTLTYSAGANGSLTGTTSQTVSSGSNGTAVTAVPNTGYHFVNWSDGSTANPRTDMNVQSNISVTANFAMNTYTLTYTSGANGSLTGATSQTVNHGENGTTVTAVSNTGYHFTNWSDASTSNPRTDNNVTADISVTANFEINTYSLTVNATNGSVSKNPNQENYDYGTEVIFTATPATGYHFTGWNGDLSGTENPDTVTMDGNKTVTANFAINTYTLSVSGDYGVVTKEPNQETYEHGTSVQVSQTPDRGYIFTGWSGDVSGTDNPLSVTMDGNKSIQANYTFNSDYEILYRTATYEAWATAKNGKDKLTSVKRKADKVFFKFNLVADSTRILLLDFGMNVNASITRGKEKLDTIVLYSGKKLKDTLTAELSQGDTIQVEGVGAMGKKIAVKYQWGKSKAVALKADSLYKLNRVGLPMPNLHNVGEELFPVKNIQAGYYSKTNPLKVGIPQGSKGANSVTHAAYQDVQKSMVKLIKKQNVLHSDTLAARCLDSLDGTKKKPIDKQQKSLPPDKQNNKLFAEALTLKLNIAASMTEKFPAGFGQLQYNDPSAPGDINGMLVSEISLLTDSVLSCLEISKDVTPGELYETVRNLNSAFADTTIDTLSFGSKTKLTGVKSLMEVDYLQPADGVEPRIVQSFETASIVPEEFALYQNYPNPFNPTTNFGFRIADFGLVTLKIYNMLGQEITTLLNREEMEEGEYEIPFDAVNLPSGVYFYRINVVGEDGILSYTDVKQMTLIK